MTNKEIEPGERDNVEKVKLSYLDDFPYALTEVARVSMYGSEGKPRKGTSVRGYGKKNWKKGLKITETYDSQRRHDLKFFGEGVLFDREALDNGFALYHLAMGAWNALAKLEMFLTKPGMDDRGLTDEEKEYMLIQYQEAREAVDSRKKV